MQLKISLWALVLLVVVAPSFAALKDQFTLSYNTPGCGGGVECRAIIRFDNTGGKTFNITNAVVNSTYVLNDTPAPYYIDFKTYLEINVTETVNGTDNSYVHRTPSYNVIYPGINYIELSSWDKPSDEAIDWDITLEVLVNNKYVTWSGKVDNNWAIWGARSIRAYYSMDSGLQDSAGGSDLTNSGVTFVSGAIIGNGTSYYDNGADYMTIPSGFISKDESNNNLTINVWVNQTSTSDYYDNVFMIRHNAGDDELVMSYGLAPVSDILYIYRYAGGSNFITCGNMSEYYNKPLMLTYVQGNSSGVQNMSCYVNGVYINSTTYTQYFASAPEMNSIGNIRPRLAQNRGFNGYIDDFTIDVTTWNASYIAAVYAAKANYTMLTGGFSDDVYSLAITNPLSVAKSANEKLTIDFSFNKSSTPVTSDVLVNNVTIGGAVCEIVNTTNPATCSGTPSACSTYGTQSPCEGAGCSWAVSGTTTTVVNYTTSQTNWEVPAGVTNITVELWGGGGTGGSTVTNSNVGAGGGAGGMYARSVINVSPGQRLNLTVAESRSHSGTANTNGLAGFNTTLANSTVLVRATGGALGVNGGGGGTGGAGSTAGGIGQIMYAGGNGGTRPATGTSGGGGGGAGSTGAGNNASGQTGGSAKAEHGGAGPNGFTTNSNGAAGGNFGAGGSGARRSATGGAGAQGLIRITYEQPTYSCTGTPNACTTYEAEGTCTGAGCDWIAGGTTYEVAHLGSGLWQANCTIGPSCTGTNNLYLEINYTVDNILLNTTNVGAIDCSGGGSSCTYSGSGTWNINCAENCAVTSNTNVGGNNIVFSGAGTVTLSAYITNWVVARIQNNCAVRVTSTGGLRW
jgi:hypothetical protein